MEWSCTKYRATARKDGPPHGQHTRTSEVNWGNAAAATDYCALRILVARPLRPCDAGGTPVRGKGIGSTEPAEASSLARGESFETVGKWHRGRK